ncbi:MAG: hypothetical protein AB1746_15695, partial [Candidatus Zixiibacteriota bacterium]
MKSFLYYLLTLTAIFILSAGIAGSYEIKNLRAAPVILEKPQNIISDAALSYLKGMNETRVKVWIFFIDKEIMDIDQFQKAASRISFSDHVEKRRSKVGLDKPTFADLPVS